MPERDRDSTTTHRRSVRSVQTPTGGLISTSACLVVLRGHGLGQRIDIGETPLTIGRAPECEFQITEPSISRQHSRIWREPSGYHIRDLGSTNSTLLNDRPISEAELNDGDQIAIGNCVLKFMERSSVEARYHEEIYQLATADPLTGLYNRRHFLELLERELARTTRHQRPLAMLIVDLDHFKEVNDRYGHPVGDTVLRQVANVLAGDLRKEVIVARIGGEEFAAVLPEQGLAPAIAFAQNLCTSIATLELAETDGPRHVTVSIGVAVWEAGMASVGGLMRAADEQLYRAKQRGRNRVCAVDE